MWILSSQEESAADKRVDGYRLLSGQNVLIEGKGLRPGDGEPINLGQRPRRFWVAGAIKASSLEAKGHEIVDRCHCHSEGQKDEDEKEGGAADDHCTGVGREIKNRPILF